LTRNFFSSLFFFPNKKREKITTVLPRVSPSPPLAHSFFNFLQKEIVKKKRKKQHPILFENLAIGEIQHFCKRLQNERKKKKSHVKKKKTQTNFY